MASFRTRAPRVGTLLSAVLALALLGALIGSFFGAAHARADQEHAAQGRAEAYVGSVLFGVLTPGMVSQPIVGSDARSLSASVAGILRDERVVRVRIWAPDRTLVYSSDEGDRVGAVLAGAGSPVSSANGGASVSVVADATAASGGLAGSDETLFQTFVPLRLFNQATVSGVAEVDQRYSAIANAVAHTWRPVQIVLALGLVGALVLLWLSFRTAPAEPRAVEAGFGTEAEPAPAIGPMPSEPTVQLGEADERVRLAESRASAVERAAREAEERARSAEQRAVELQAQLSSATSAREGLEAEVAAAQAATAALRAAADQAAELARRVEELERRRADEAASLASAQRATAQAMAQAAEAESRIRELEREGAGPEPVQHLASILTAGVAGEEVASITDRLARLRRDVEERRGEAAGAGKPPDGEPPDGEREEELSLRERLARSAAARHRTTST